MDLPTSKKPPRKSVSCLIITYNNRGGRGEPCLLPLFWVFWSKCSRWSHPVISHFKETAPSYPFFFNLKSFKSDFYLESTKLINSLCSVVNKLSKPKEMWINVLFKQEKKQVSCLRSLNQRTFSVHFLFMIELFYCCFFTLRLVRWWCNLSVGSDLIILWWPLNEVGHLCCSDFGRFSRGSFG